ncbi:MAG: hypothetical protein EOO47_27695, partial [Flavobacterium sp.]
MRLKLILIGCLVCTLFFGVDAHAQKAETFTVAGNTYYGTKAIPKEITGIYKFEKTKEPIAEINEDGSGYFQPHDVPK